MAIVKKKKAAKAKLPSKELVIWDCILSYPVLDKPKLFKGNLYYSIDGLLEKNDAQCKEIRTAIKEIAVEMFGEDESEWPEKIHMLQNGDDNQDSKGYKGRRFFKASTKNFGPANVIDANGKPFNPAMVKGGMYGNIAINISGWENEGDYGISIYLQGVQVDAKKPYEAFGGGKSAAQLFGTDKDDDDTDTDEDDVDADDADGEEEEEEQTSKKSSSSKKKKSRIVEEEEDEDLDEDTNDGDDQDEEPRSKKSSVKSKKKTTRNFDDDED